MGLGSRAGLAAGAIVLVCILPARAPGEEPPDDPRVTTSGAARHTSRTPPGRIASIPDVLLAEAYSKRLQ